MSEQEKKNIYNAIQNLYNMDFTTWQEVLAELYNLVAGVEQKYEAFDQKFKEKENSLEVIETKINND